MGRPRGADRPGVARALLGLLLLLHLGVAVGRVSRIPAPERTFHDFDTFLVQHALVLRGERAAWSLPVAEVVPPGWTDLDAQAVLRAAVANSPDHVGSYKTATPLFYVAAAALPVVAGLGPLTARLGPLVLLFALVLLAWDAGRRLGGRPTAGLAAAVLLSTLPVAHQGAVVGIPALGNMAGVALALWALLRSDGLARWGFAALAGVALALAPRWGESVGDGLECLVAVVGPALVVALVPFARLLRRRTRRAGLRGLVGLALAGAIVHGLLDRWWIGTHLQRYVLVEAGVQRGPTVDLGQRVAGTLATLQANRGVYLDVLVHSLLGPLGALVLAVGGALCLLRLKPRAAALALAASVGGALLVLSLSSKGQDTYAVGVVPALAVAAGVGLSRVRGLAGLGAAAGLSAFLFQAHVDLPALARVRCTPWVATWLGGDEAQCQRPAPAPAVYHWFREWRRLPNDHVLARRAIGDWVVSGPGRAWVDALPAGALVLLQRPPGPGGGADVLAVLVQSLRPDVDVHVLQGRGLDPLTRRLLQGHETAELVTLVREMAHAGGSPEDPLPDLAGAVRVGEGPGLRRYSLPDPASMAGAPR